VPLVPVTRSDGPATPLRWRVPACNSLVPPSTSWTNAES
jgi:hypothetical protein